MLTFHFTMRRNWQRKLRKAHKNSGGFYAPKGWGRTGKHSGTENPPLRGKRHHLFFLEANLYELKTLSVTQDIFYIGSSVEIR